MNSIIKKRNEKMLAILLKHFDNDLSVIDDYLVNEMTDQELNEIMGRVISRLEMEQGLIVDETI